MTRQEYIDAVKVKIEEISPFDEPDAFIGENDDSAHNVKPIKEYITKSLDEAASNCLSALPLSLVHSDVQALTPSIAIGTDGVGKFVIEPQTRFIRFRHSELKRDITAFITSEDAQYLIQQNEYVHAGQNKPVAVVSSDIDETTGKGVMEIYSLAKSASNRTDATNGKLLYINLNKKPGVVTDYPASTPGTYQYTADELIKSPIDEYIVLECARIVFNILKDYDGAKVCENEQQTKIQSILQ